MTARASDSILRVRHVRARTGLSVSTIYRREAAGTFPARVGMGPSSVGWYASDVARWIENPAGYAPA